MSTPAHKQADPAKAAGQIINPVNTDIMDDMGQYASPVISPRYHEAYSGGIKPLGEHLTNRVTWNEGLRCFNGTTARDLAVRTTWETVQRNALLTRRGNPIEYTTTPPLPDAYTGPSFGPRR